LFLRLNADVNDRLRAQTRYQGDLSRSIDEALTRADLNQIELVPAKAGKSTPGLTAVISTRANALLRAAAKQRRCSINSLANSALRSWLWGND
jgi:hypothetical protein